MKIIEEGSRVRTLRQIFDRTRTACVVAAFEVEVCG